MRKIKLNKPLVESSTPPSSTNVYWVDIDESTGNVKSIKSFNTVTNSWESTMLSSDALKFNGITYNEELNSVSVGTKTSISGLDLFVFGKHNVQDPDKVEIVGGENIIKPQTYFDYNSLLNIGDKALYWHGYPDNIEYEGTIIGKTESDIIQYFNNFGYINLKVNNFPVNETIAYIYTIGSDDDAGRPLPLTLVTIDKKVYSGKHWKSGGYKESLNTFTFELIDPETNIAYWEVSLLLQFEKEIIESKNIRTLDWEGTQWNAGDITCDDGNGNTISMRDLLSRIQALENV